jgi:acetyl-CoA acetyltransferase
MSRSETSTAIVGVGESSFARRLDASLEQLVTEASRRAIADAGLTPGEIDGFVPAASAHPPADDLAAALGSQRAFTAAPGYTPGSGSVAALRTARLAIGAGLARHVLVYSGFKGSRAGGPYSFHAEDPIKAALEMPFGFYGQPAYFAAWAQRYCHEYGLKPDDLAPISIASRAWAARTPGAQKPDAIGLDDYRASPMIASPLRALDCCVISDGAAAYVVTSLERARDLPRPPVVVAGVGVASMDVTLTSLFTQASDVLSLGSARSGPAAYADAGIGPAEIDVAEIYDCFSISEVIQMEDLGLAPRGEGYTFAAGGAIAPGGRMPVNTNGGHLSYAYIPGMNHVVEATRQLRGERAAAQVPGAEVALVAALGGNDHATAVLTGDR